MDAGTTLDAPARRRAEVEEYLAKADALVRSLTERLHPGAAPAPRDVRGTRVVVVDLYDNARSAVAELLREVGYEVVEATRAADLPPEEDARTGLVILDPGPDLSKGLRLVRRIRLDPDSRGLRILLQSSTLAFGGRDEALAAGCDECLPKPCAPAELMAAVERMIGAPRLT